MIPPRDDTNVVFDYGDCIYINIYIFIFIVFIAIPQVVFPLALILSHIRSVQLPQTKIMCFQILNHFCHYCNINIKLERLVPYLLSIITEEENAIVRIHAIELLVNVLESIENYPLTESSLYIDYILPIFSSLTNEKYIFLYI